MPARITDPGVGASTWASGNHVCSGKIGTLMAKESANAPKHKSCSVGVSTMRFHSSRLKV